MGKSIPYLLFLLFSSPFFLNHVSAQTSPGADMNEISERLCKAIKSRNGSRFSQELMRLEKQYGFTLVQSYDNCDCKKKGAFSGGSLLRAATYYRAIDVIKIIFVELLKNPDSQKGLSDYLNYREGDGTTLLDWVRERVEFLGKNTKQQAQMQQSINYMIGYRKRGAKFSCEILEGAECDETYQQFLDRILKR